MSFAADVKNELCGRAFGTLCCMRAELEAFVLFAAHIEQDSMKIITEHPSVARRIFSLCKKVYGLNATVRIKPHSATQTQSMYHVLLESGTIGILKDLGIQKDAVQDFRINNQTLQNECCMKAFMRGAFLSCGSINDPEKNYHLEFVTHRRRLSGDLVALLCEFDMEARVTIRKSNYVVYLKSSEPISDVLNLCGAHHALMEMENIRILKEMKNNVNRMVNCETANVGKVVSAAGRQLDAIRQITEHMPLSNLPPQLAELAQLRLENPEASLEELGRMTDPPISKSGVNHRFRKLLSMAKEGVYQQHE